MLSVESVGRTVGLNGTLFDNLSYDLNLGLRITIIS